MSVPKLNTPKAAKQKKLPVRNNRRSGLYLSHLLSIGLILGFASVQLDAAEVSDLSKMKARAVSWYGNKKYETAIDLFEKIVQRDRFDTDSKYMLAVSYEKTSRFVEAYRNYNDLASQVNKYPEIPFRMGLIAFTLKDHSRAIGHFEACEKRNTKTETCSFLRAQSLLALGKQQEAEDLFKKLQESSTVGETREGAKFYLAQIQFEKEKAKKSKRYPRTVQLLTALVEADPNSAVGRAAAARLLQIQGTAGKPSKEGQPKFAGSVSQDSTYDTNALNESDGLTTKTNARSFIFNTIVDGKYFWIQGESFYLTPTLNLNFLYNQAAKGKDQAEVKKSNSFSPSVLLNMGSQWGSTELTYPIRYKPTYNDQNGDGVLSYYSTGYSLSPSLRWKLLGENFTSLQTDITRTQNVTAAQSTTAVKGGLNQTWAIIPKVLDSSFTSSATYTFLYNDKVAYLFSVNFTVNGPWDLAISPGFNYTITNNIVQQSRGTETNINPNININKVFGGSFAANIHYDFEKNSADLGSAEYDKHKVGFRLSVTF